MQLKKFALQRNFTSSHPTEYALGVSFRSIKNKPVALVGESNLTQQFHFTSTEAGKVVTASIQLSRGAFLFASLSDSVYLKPLKPQKAATRN